MTNMKTTLISIFVFIVAMISSTADGAKLLDLSKAFSEEKLISQTKMAKMENYSYAADISIGYTQMKMVVEGKKYLSQIVVIRK